MKKVYIVIDMQRDFVDMALGTKEAVAIVKPMHDYLAALPEGSLIIATRDTHQENYLETNEGKHLPVKHCIEKSEGWQIVSELSDIPFTTFINKPNFGISATMWKDILNGSVDEIVMMGLCTDICVVSNALALKVAFPEARVSIIKSLCAGVTPETHDAAIKTMAMCQVEII